LVDDFGVMQRGSRLLLGAILLAATSSVASAIPADASEAPGAVAAAEVVARGHEAEQYLFDQLNVVRVENGQIALVRDPLLDQIAIEWTDTMLPTGTISHRPDLSTQVRTRITTQWRRIGENVGWGPSAQWLHTGFWNSAPHKANMLGDYNRVGIGARVEADGDVWVTVNFLKGPYLAPTPPPAPAVQLPAVDSWAVTPEGVVTAFGAAPWLGDASQFDLTDPIVGISATPSGNGYWLVARDGGIFTFGDAEFHGSTGAIHLNQPIVAMSSTPTGDGYWLTAADGGIFTFGDADFHGSTGALQLNMPIVAMAPTPSGAGYWLTAADGGIFTFGDADFHGSTGALRLVSPVSAMASTPSGKGYWLVAKDGGVFTFGDAVFSGSAAGAGMSGDVIGMARGHVGSEIDYWVYSGTGVARGYGHIDSAPTPELDPSGRIAGVTVRPID